MKFSVSKEVFELFEGFSIGIVICDNIDNSGSSEELDKLISEVTELVKTNFVPEELAKHPLISPWKSAFFDFDKKPKELHSSVEKLTKQAIDGTLESKNKALDICNLISLKHIVPIECFDENKIQDELVLKRAEGDERFYDPSKKTEVNPEKGELIYKDKLNVLARKLDYIEGDKAAVDEKSSRVVVLIEGLTPLLKTTVEEIAKEVAELFTSFCKAHTSVIIADKENSTVEF